VRRASAAAGTMIALCFCAPVKAAGGPLGIDHLIGYDDSGIWKRRNQTALSVATAAAVVGGALWEGNDTRLGRTFWQSLDAVALGEGTAQGMKYIFSRARPNQTDDPNQWFKGHGHQSFPSGEVMEITTAVTPFVLEYGHDNPAVYALELLPLYDAVARVKVRGHWQSDVLGSLAIGTGLGIYAHSRPTSMFVGILPGGMTVGWKKKF
jgi:membrane-associated phospholipid phosphatase